MAAQNFIGLASNYGDAMEHYNGVDLTMSARLQQGVVLSGGLSMGRVETNYCFVTSSPQGTGCRPRKAARPRLGCCIATSSRPFSPTSSCSASYPLPWGASRSRRHSRASRAR